VISPQLVSTVASNVLPAAVALSGSRVVLTAVGVGGAGVHPATVAEDAGVAEAEAVPVGLAAGVAGSSPSRAERKTKSATTASTAPTTTATWRFLATSCRWAAARASSFS
jgi:hypothetical protein